MAADNKTLGKFLLDGIPPSPRGMPQIEVTFDIDVNGILNVKAKDKATGKEQAVKIEASSGLTKDDIEKMKKDAEAHVEDDKKKRELVELRNVADTLVYSAEKSLRDLPAGQAGAGDKVSADIKKNVEDKITALKAVKDSQDAAAIKTATDELSKVLQTIGEAMYKQQPQGEQPGTGNNPEGENKKPEDKIKDADFEEKK